MVDTSYYNPVLLKFKSYDGSKMCIQFTIRLNIWSGIIEKILLKAVASCEEKREFIYDFYDLVLYRKNDSDADIGCLGEITCESYLPFVFCC